VSDPWKLVTDHHVEPENPDRPTFVLRSISAGDVFREMADLCDLWPTVIGELTIDGKPAAEELGRLVQETHLLCRVIKDHAGLDKT
jgi:hypothetical protein